MKEYIEREAARDLMERALEDDWEIQYANDRLRDIPAADVVEVVRCRECKWWVREGNDSYGYAMFCDHDCSLGGQGIKKPEDYCSYGERKGGDE